MQSKSQSFGHRPPLIGLYSRAPQAGKTTVSKLLQSEGYFRMSFADPLKHVANAFFDVIGVDPFNLIDKERAVPTNVDISVSPRHVWQTLGTEWGRECIDPDLWVKIAEYKIKLHRHQGMEAPIVFDDVRFLNEFEMIRRLGGEMWIIHRYGVNSNGHKSDGLLDGVTFDRAIGNNGSIKDLQSAIQTVVGDHSSSRLGQVGAYAAPHWDYGQFGEYK